MLPSLPMPRLALLLLPALSLSTINYRLPTSPQKPTISLSPRYTPGQSLRYQVELRTITETQSSGPIVNPQAASALTLSVTVVVRLDVSAAAPPAPAGSLRLRATFEKVVAAVRTDAFDPAATDLEESYRRLEGLAPEFTLDPAGKIVLPDNPSVALPAAVGAPGNQQWLSDLIRGASNDSSPTAVSIAQSWSHDRVIPNSPLIGLSIRSTSTYLRDEPCRTSFSAQSSAAPAPPSTQPTPAPSGATDESCAVILTKFSTSQRPANPKDPTPPDYKARGLRTSGSWAATGESLAYVSLRTGLTWSVTQSGEEQMDFTVTSTPPPLPDPGDDSSASAKPAAKSSSRPAAKSPAKSASQSKSSALDPDAPTMHYRGRVRTSSSLTLLP